VGNSLECLARKIDCQLRKGVKLQELKSILKNYSGSDWKQYTKFCENGYTRNLVFRNKRFEILVLCWNKNQKSGIHNHPNGGCLVKLLKGFQLIEHSYKLEKDNKIKWLNSHNIRVGDISYQQGSSGLHNIVNPSKKHCAVTLHVYCPPNYKPDFFEK
jgi:cysteine dioxygenase